jgi:hypothetical protein
MITLKLNLQKTCSFIAAFLLFTGFLTAQSQNQKQYRPPLFFREDFREIPAATPVTNEHLSNKMLQLGFYGPGADSIKKSHHPQPIDDPYYVWSGLCRGNWALTLKHKNSMVDLTGYSKILWRSEQSGLRNLHIVLKLANGTWLVSVQGEGSSVDWKITEFNLSELQWYTLNIKNIVEIVPAKNPDLSKVDEIGFTDLMTGGRSDACSRLDWIEVYGKPVPR